MMMMMMLFMSLAVRMIASVTATVAATAAATAITSNFDRYHVRIRFLQTTPTMSSSTAVVV